MKLTPKEQLQHYKDTKGQPINTDEYTYVDTKQLQIRSVIEFMSELSYDFYPAFGQTFAARYECGFKGCEVISFNTAVKLHDTNWMRSNPYYLCVPEFSFVNKLAGGYYERTFQIDSYTLNKAQACKIVERVYVHCTKKGLLKSYKNQVQFTDSAYEQLFLQPLIDKESK